MSRSSARSPTHQPSRAGCILNTATPPENLNGRPVGQLPLLRGIWQLRGTTKPPSVCLCSASDCLVEGTCSEEAAKGNKRSRFPSNNHSQAQPPLSLSVRRRPSASLSHAAYVTDNLALHHSFRECTAYIFPSRELLIPVVPPSAFDVPGDVGQRQDRRVALLEHNTSSGAS